MISRRQTLAGAVTLVAAGRSARAATPRLDHTLGFRLQNYAYVNAGGVGQTFNSLYNLETAPSRVRLIWFNDRPEPWTLEAAAVATTSAVHDGVTPVGSDGREDATLWRTVTFTGAAPGEPPGRLVLPGHPGPPGQPLLRLSDWINVAALPRRDEGAGALLLVRCFSPGKIRYSGGLPPDPAIGRIYRGAWSLGNSAAPPYVMQPVNRHDGVHACYGLQYVSAVPGITVIGIGDSIMQSLGTKGTVSGFGFRACALVSTPRRPVSYVNEGYSGRTSVDYGADGLRDIALFKPQVTLIQAWSENDPHTQQAADASFALATQLVEATRRAGGTPVLVTAAPVFQYAPQVEPFRRDSNARVRALAQQGGLPVLDVDAIWGTAAFPSAYRAEYDSGDHTHPNDAAAAAAGVILADMLRRILDAG